MTASNDLNISQSGIVTFDGTATFFGRTLIGGTGVTVINGNGIAGNPTISLTGGGGAVEHLTGDTGGLLNPDGSNNFNLFGQLAGSTTVFDTIGSGSTISFENRAWLSRYVVDTSTTVGLRGTYATLQAAITQAIADGATGVGATIYIRNATISETITVSTASVNIAIIGTTSKNNTEIQGAAPLFTGSFTNSGSGNIFFSNIDFSGAATLTNSSTGGIFLYQSFCLASITQSNASGQVIIGNSQVNSATITFSAGIISAYQSGFSGGTITLSNAAAYSLFNCVTSQTFAGGTSTNVVLYQTNFQGTNSLNSGTLVLRGFSTGISNLLGNTNISYTADYQAGNIYVSVRSAVSYVALNGDYYIGITSTASARTVTLPNTNLNKGQSFIVKDESGGAAAHNITISVNGGVKTIDGQASYVISTNYGAVSLIYDGTNFFSF